MTPTINKFRAGLAAMAFIPLWLSAQADELASTAVQPAPYNFAWKISGAAAAAPIQVFDSGSRVLLQFKDLTHVPAILADVPGGQILLEWHSELPYVVINHMESHLVFHLGGAVAYATRKDSNDVPQGVVTGAAVPVTITASALTPVPHEQLVDNRIQADEHASDRSVLRDHPDDQEGVPMAAPAQNHVAHGVPSIPASFQGGQFDLRLEDKTIDQALRRWAQGAGWTVHWVSTIAPPITAASDVPGDFLTACATVQLALQKAGYPLAAVIDADHKTYLIHDVTTASTASTK